MPMRFLIQSPVNLGANLTLDAERSHYLCKVMRMKSGDEVMCFDGRGTSYKALLVKVEQKKSVLQVTAIDPCSAPQTTALHLGLSVLKGQAMDRAMQQATELGATEITLIKANRSNVLLNAKRMDTKMAHWRKIIASACEQSGRLYLPVLNPPVVLDALLESAGATKPLVFELDGVPLPRSLPMQPRLLLIGPEGGWDEAERSLFTRQGIDRYSLGANTLRAETTPAVALALIQHLQRSV